MHEFKNCQHDAWFREALPPYFMCSALVKRLPTMLALKARLQGLEETRYPDWIKPNTA